MKVYDYELISLWDWAYDHRQPDYVPPQLDNSKGEFVGFINPGVMVLFYENSPQELHDLTQQELQKRLYKVTEFKKGGRICLRWHREARSKKEVEKAMKQKFGCEASSKLPLESQYQLLFISPGTFQNHTLFAGIDFDIAMDGKITFRK